MPSMIAKQISAVVFILIRTHVAICSTGPGHGRADSQRTLYRPVDESGAALSLLQLESAPVELLTRPSARYDTSLQAVMPIEWVHVAKTGSSFANTLIHIPGICTGITSKIENIRDTVSGKCPPAEWQCDASALNSARFDHFSVEFDPSTDESIALRANHEPLCAKAGLLKSEWPRGGFSAGKGRFMMFARQPEQRILSYYYYTASLGLAKVISLSDIPTSFWETNSGCVTKMLTRSLYDCPLTKKAAAGILIGTEETLPGSVAQPPTDADVQEAIDRLKTGFSFIGITEQWNLSICLFNKMFGQACSAIQFEDTRPTKGNESMAYDTAGMNGWRDQYDNKVYDAAMAIFESNLNKLQVTEASCEPCYREAGLL